MGQRFFPIDFPGHFLLPNQTSPTTNPMLHRKTGDGKGTGFYQHAGLFEQDVLNRVGKGNACCGKL